MAVFSLYFVRSEDCYVPSVHKSSFASCCGRKRRNAKQSKHEGVFRVQKVRSKHLVFMSSFDLRYFCLMMLCDWECDWLEFCCLLCVNVDECDSCMTMAIAFSILHVLQRLNSVKLIATCVLVVIVVTAFFLFPKTQGLISE